MKIKSLRFVSKLFRQGNVCVTGLRGKGKDLLMSNVAIRRKKSYISNVDYGGECIPLRFDDLDCGGNTYDNFISGKIKFYEFSHPRGSDVYISDAGIYLPSQYCNELNKKYPHLATYMAISRHVSGNNVHFNSQNLNRVWDKIREQSDTYIACNWCLYLFGLVFQVVTVYDKYQSCVDRVKPCKVRVPLFNAQAKMQARTYRDNFSNVHGDVRRYLLVYRNKSKYDTHHFNKLLKEGVTSDEKVS